MAILQCHQADRLSILKYIRTSYTYTYSCSSTRVCPSMLTRVDIDKFHTATLTSLTSFYVTFGDRTQIYIDIIAWIDYCPLTQGPITTPLPRIPTPTACVKTLYTYPDKLDEGTNPARMSSIRTPSPSRAQSTPPRMRRGCC